MDKSAKSVAKYQDSSLQKMKMAADIIRGKEVSKAVDLLGFARTKSSKMLLKVLSSAIANAENNHEMDIDNLYVHEVWANKASVLKRIRARARGRVGRILKPTCHITVLLRERAKV